MATPVAALPERITELLLSEGYVTREAIDAAQRDAKMNATTVTHSLIKTGAIAEVDLTKIIARTYRMPAVDLSKFEVDPKILKLVPSELAARHGLLPLKRDGRTLTVAVADPTNQEILEDLKFITRYDIFPVLAGEATLRAVIEKGYDTGDMALAMDSLLKDIAGAEGDVEVVEDEEDEMSAAALAAAVDDAPVVKLINAILTDAVKRGASDIHFESFEHELRVRYRIDGALQEVMKPPPKLKAALISRFKIMSQLNIAERRVPQDGRIKLKIGNKVIDYRVSTLPTLFGEKVVLRILDKGNLTLDLEKFGLEPRSEKEMMSAIMNPYGMVLVTGPTGSGKTTTLYSALNELNSPVYNIVTVEDPVEFQIPGINQVPVRKEIGLTFANALRSILRQDPDIVMIGEIRDTETAEIAVESALTGHQVLSTMHCNDAPGAITRLDDMGIAPFLISSSVILACAQRLMRRICSHCKEPVTYPAKMFQDLAIDPSVFDGVTLYRGRGCDRCKNTGYTGRLAIIEAMTVTDEIRKLVIARGSSRDMSKVALGQGMRTLRMVALDRVRDGLSTLEQVLVLTSAH